MRTTFETREMFDRRPVRIGERKERKQRTTLRMRRVFSFPQSFSFLSFISLANVFSPPSSIEVSGNKAETFKQTRKRETLRSKLETLKSFVVKKLFASETGEEKTPL